jgi:kanamycin kinase
VRCSVEVRLKLAQYDSDPRRPSEAGLASPALTVPSRRTRLHTDPPKRVLATTYPISASGPIQAADGPGGRLPANEIVRADELAGRCEATGCNSHRGSVVKTWTGSQLDSRRQDAVLRSVRPLKPQDTVLEAPSELLDEHATWTWEPVSVYPGRSAMHRLASAAGQTRFLKVVRHGWTPSAEAEAERTAWAHSFLPVPRVLKRGVTQDATWLLTEGIDSVDATAAKFRQDVPGLVTRLAEGLRYFHSTPVDECPFQFRVADAIQLVCHRLETGQIVGSRDFHPEFAALSEEAAVEELLAGVPDSEDLVVCHGDYCAPNILLRGTDIVGYVDLGELGVADRWWDLAVATWSITWNFGPGYEDRFLETYGVQRDDHRTRFYRLLYDLAS